MTTLVLMIAAAVAGAWLGAGVVSQLAAAPDPARHGRAAARRGGDHAWRA